MIALTTTAQSLKPAKSTIEVGQMAYMRPTTYTIEYHNVSDKTVRITRVDTGCGCVTAEYPKSEIAPGKKAEIVLTFDGKLLGHYTRVLRVFDSETGKAADTYIEGQVVTKLPEPAKADKKDKKKKKKKKKKDEE